MYQRISFACLTISALIFSLPAGAADLVYPGGGAIAQVVDGGNTYTSITLVNMDSLPAPYTLKFYGDDGNPLTLSTTAGPPATQLTGTLNPGASAIIKTNGGASTISQGWALLTTGFTQDSAGYYHYTIAGSAIFGISLPAAPLVEASVPLDTGTDSEFALPFDYTNSVVGVAIANSYQTTQLTVNVKAYDLSGNSLFTDTLQLPGMGHTAFMLADKYPQLAGTQGIVIFTGTGTDQNNPNGYMNVLGLRANLAGTTFTSIIPVVPCYYVSNASGSGCTN